jgi:hypothetical protein
LSCPAETKPVCGARDSNLMAFFLFERTLNKVFW